MSDSKFQPGAFVSYEHLGKFGVGKVKDGGDNPLVEFWSGRRERKKVSELVPVPDSEPIALLWDEPGELAPWAKEKPLKLVALALFIDGGRGRPVDVKEKLGRRVPLGSDWKTWWSRRAKSLNAFSALPEPKHFEKSAKGSVYTLLCGTEAVPDDARPPVSLDDWKKWLLNDTKLPTFGRNPGKNVAESLVGWPADTIEQVLDRTLWGANLLLDSPRKRDTAALAWMDAVGSTALRYSELYPDGSHLTERSGNVLSRLAQHTKRREAVLFKAGALSEGPDRQRLLAQQWQEQERQRTDYEARLEQQRQEQERQRTDYEARLERQRQEQEHQDVAHTTELEALRHSHEAELERDRQEQERLQDRVETLRNQLFSGHEQSKLDIRQDMLVIVGELSQLATRQKHASDDFLRDVRAGLALALQAGDAKTFGATGDLSRFDPLKHQGNESIRIGDSVKITAPGVIVKGQHTDDRVLVKARVSEISENR